MLGQAGKVVHRILIHNEITYSPLNYVGDISSNKAAKVLGNGWTVDVIAHIFSGLKE